jgi:TfoX/Sxy family transcriptional regulator of competence genes
MAYDEKLTARVREYFVPFKKVEEKKMFGGICFMLNDKMCVGVSKDDLMVRFDPELQETIMNKKGARPMDFTNKIMKGYVFVTPDGVKNKKDLDYWVNLALDFNSRAKSSKKAKKEKAKKK